MGRSLLVWVGQVWALDSGELLQTLSCHDRAVIALALVGANTDTPHIVSASLDGSVRRWTADTWDRVKTHKHRSVVRRSLTVGSCCEGLVLLVTRSVAVGLRGECASVVKADGGKGACDDGEARRLACAGCFITGATCPCAWR
jgi:WD40 repeat protein